MIAPFAVKTNRAMLALFPSGGQPVGFAGILGVNEC